MLHPYGRVLQGTEALLARRHGTGEAPTEALLARRHGTGVAPTEALLARRHGTGEAPTEAPLARRHGTGVAPSARRRWGAKHISNRCLAHLCKTAHFGKGSDPTMFTVWRHFA